MQTQKGFVLNSLQVSIFTHQLTRIRTSLAMGAILSKFAGRYSGAPISFPEEVSSSVSLPSAVLRSEPDEWQVAIRSNRVDSMWRLPATENGDYDEPNQESVYSDALAPILELLDIDLQLTVGRMAVVSSRFQPVQTQQSAASILIDRFCSEQSKSPANDHAPFRNSQSFQIHNHKRYVGEDGIEINSWVRCKSGKLSKSELPIIDVEQDINTPQEALETAVFTKEQVRLFF